MAAWFEQLCIAAQSDAKQHTPRILEFRHEPQAMETARQVLGM